ncbi:hypothetical protein WA158_000919 [Blastocystis sp. Blastoise]
MNTTEPTPILNKENHRKPRKHVTWDEVTIQEQDKERGTRQKIDEPDTPFVFNAPRMDVTDETLPNGENDIMRRTSFSEDSDLNSPYSPSDESDNVHKEDNKEVFFNLVVNEITKKVEQEKDLEEKSKQHEEFLRKRKAHYNEYVTMKHFKDDQKKEVEKEENEEASDEKNQNKSETNVVENHNE